MDIDISKGGATVNKKRAACIMAMETSSSDAAGLYTLDFLSKRPGPLHVLLGGVDPHSGAVVLFNYQDSFRYTVVLDPKWVKGSMFEYDEWEEKNASIAHTVYNQFDGTNKGPFCTQNPPRMSVTKDLCVFAPLDGGGSLVAFRMPKGEYFQHISNCQASAVCIDTENQRVIYATTDGNVKAMSIKVQPRQLLVPVPQLLYAPLETFAQVTSIACDPTTGTIFLASRNHHVIRVLKLNEHGEYELLHTFGNGQRGEWNDDQKHASTPSVFSGTDAIYCVLDGNLYKASTSNNPPQLIWMGHVGSEAFINKYDQGSPDPHAREIMAVNHRGAYASVEQDYHNDYLVRRLYFPQPITK